MKRKILSLALAVMMVLPLLTVNVLAALPSHDPHFVPAPQPITIHGSNSLNIVDEKFEIFKIFDLESWDILTSGAGYDPSNPLNNERFAYRINPAFEGFDGTLTWNFAQSYFSPVPAELAAKGSNLLLKELLEYLRKNSKPSALYADIGSPEVLEVNNDSWAVPLTKALIDYIESKGIAPNWVKTASSDPYVINDLPLGYFLIRSEHYNPSSTNADGKYDDKSDRVTAIAALRTNEVKVDIYCKADAPPMDKDVWHTPQAGYTGGAPEGWGGFTDVNIEDTVWFKLTSKVPNMSGYSKYYMTMYDLLSPGLMPFNNDIRVYIAPPSVNLTTQPLSYFVNYNAETGAGTHISPAGAKNVTGEMLTAGAVVAAGYNIMIDFGDIKRWYNTQADGTVTNGKTNYVGWDIVVIYSANLNDQAVITVDPKNTGAPSGHELGNPNKAWLEYSNNPYKDTKGKTRDKFVTVFTFDFKIKKYFRDAREKEVTDLVEGAAFNLYKANGFTWKYDNGTNKVEVLSGTPENFIDLFAAGKKTPGGASYIEGQYMHTVKAVGDAGTTIYLHSPIGANMNGFIDIIGLEAGVYYLVETHAPKGYNLLEAPIKIVIEYTAGNDKLSPWKALTLTKKYQNETDYIYGDIKGDLKECDDRMPILNKSGIKFPETGGTGTVIFYIIGGLLTVGTGFLLIVRSQTSKKKERERAAGNAKQQKAAI